MKVVHVAVAVIENSHGEFLIARRPDHLHLGGFWEFPGGKVEADETVFQALQRELREEVALDIHSATPMLKIPFHYPDKQVLLDVWRVTDFSGIAHGCEGQVVQWVARDTLRNYAFPAANRAIVTALQLSQRLLITGNFLDAEDCLQRTKNALEQQGVRLVMLRAHHLSQQDFSALAEQMAVMCHAHHAKLLLNTAPEYFLSSADGLHLSSQRLMQCGERPVLLAADKSLGASCHNTEEIQRAVAIGADYITLSPVLPTHSHPDQSALGWRRFTELVSACPLPVFALGGVSDEHLPQANAAGAWGVAGISAWWE